MGAKQHKAYIFKPGRNLVTWDKSDSGKQFRQQFEIWHQKQANAISVCLCIGIMT